MFEMFISLNEICILLTRKDIEQHREGEVHNYIEIGLF